MCKAFCPASATKVFYGGHIDSASASNGERYADSENAFAYRKALRADCTCNGRTRRNSPGGPRSTRRYARAASSPPPTAWWLYRRPPRRRPGCGLRRLPPSGLAVDVRARLGEMKVAPVSAEMAGETVMPEASAGSRCGDGGAGMVAPKAKGPGSELAQRPAMTPITFSADRYFSSIAARAAARFSR
jgi:hypothetical protein